jgi:hypothetical protein
MTDPWLQFIDVEKNVGAGHSFRIPLFEKYYQNQNQQFG